VFQLVKPLATGLGSSIVVGADFEYVRDNANTLLIQRTVK
jgi:hypothetical protein